MGVLGLWSLLHTVHKPTSLESLEGKILAIDISIWLNQALKSGNTSSNAHLHTLFFRLCKLLHFKVKPIFVFDGVAPDLKKITLEKRRRQRFDADEKAKKSREQMLQTYLKRYVLKQQSSKTKPDSNSGVQPIKSSQIDPSISMFQLPERDNESELLFPDVNNFDDEQSFTQIAKDYLSNTDDSPDIDSNSFKSMPLEVQHEIIQDLINTEKYKASYSSDPLDLPKESNNFSQFQMNRLLKRSNLQKRLDDIRQDINQRDTELVTQEYIRGQPKSRITARRIVSQDTGHVILIKTYKEQKNNTEKHSSIETSIPCVEEHQKNEHLLEESLTLESSQDDLELTEMDMNSIKELSKRLLSSGDSSVKQIDDSMKQDYAGAEERIESESSQSSDSKMELIDDVIADNDHSERTNIVEHHRGIEPEKDNVKAHTISPSASSDEDDFIDVSPLASPRLHRVQSTLESRKTSRNSSRQHSQSSIRGDDIAVEETELSPIKSAVSDRHVISFEKSGFDSEEISQMVNNQNKFTESMAMQSFSLVKEVHRQETLAATVTQRFVADAQELLRLFGVPYVMSPQEAEAQCAYLDLKGLTDGSITEDSDIWLFGARKVYKNFFNQNKNVEAFCSSHIEQVLGLSRSRMIGIAYLCGSDYCEGIPGVGPVTAMEILAEFPAEDALQSIKHFSQWWKNCKSLSLHSQSSLSKLRENLAKLYIPDDFPQEIIQRAYLNPIVDESEETFSWGTPDLDLIREFGARKLGWSKAKIDDHLLPVLRKISEKSEQKKITDFFTSPEKKVNFDDKIFVDKVFQSKRLKRALTKMGQTDNIVDNFTKESEIAGSSQRKKKRKQTQKTSCSKYKKSAKVPSHFKSSKSKNRDVAKRTETPRIVEEIDLSEDSSFNFSSDSDLDDIMKNMDTNNL